jgi:hypothetical protein
MASHLNNPGYWRDRAEEIRAIAEHLKNASAKATILACASDYELLALRAEQRLKLTGSQTAE